MVTTLVLRGILLSLLTGGFPWGVFGNFIVKGGKAEEGFEGFGEYGSFSLFGKFFPFVLNTLFMLPTRPCKSCWILICSCQKITEYENGFWMKKNYFFHNFTQCCAKIFLDIRGKQHKIHFWKWQFSRYLKKWKWNLFIKLWGCVSFFQAVRVLGLRLKGNLSKKPAWKIAGNSKFS